MNVRAHKIFLFQIIHIITLEESLKFLAPHEDISEYAYLILTLEDSRTTAARNDELSVCVGGNTFTWISRKTN